MASAEKEDVQFSQESLQTAVAALEAERSVLAAEIASLRQRLETANLQAESPRAPNPQPQPSSAGSDSSLEAILTRAVSSHLIPQQFSGTDKDSPVSFYRTVEHLVNVRNISFGSLTDVFASLLTGPAAAWFRSVKPSLHTNEDILRAFKVEYLPPNMEIAILASIRAARQRDNESTVQFIDRICEFSSLPTDRPSAEVIQTIIIGVRPQVALYLGARHESLGALRAEARRIDSLLPKPPPPRQGGPPPALQGANGSKVCFKCGRPGHIRRQCPNKQKNGQAALPQGRELQQQEF